MHICLLYSLTVFTGIWRKNERNGKSNLTLEARTWRRYRGAKNESWVRKLESKIAMQQALAKCDDTFQAMAWLYCHDFSWDQIGAAFRMSGEQARKRFEYGVQKLRRLLENPPEEGPEPK